MFCRPGHGRAGADWSRPELELALRSNRHTGCSPSWPGIPTGDLLSAGNRADRGEYLELRTGIVRKFGMNIRIQSFDNLHDNRVLRYCADFEANTLNMDTQTEAGKIVSVHFSGLLTHWFENVIQNNILFGMDEITVSGFLSSTQNSWTALSNTAFLPAVTPRNCGKG